MEDPILKVDLIQQMQNAEKEAKLRKTERTLTFAADRERNMISNDFFNHRSNKKKLALAEREELNEAFDNSLREMQSTL